MRLVCNPTMCALNAVLAASVLGARASAQDVEGPVRVTFKSSGVDNLGPDSSKQVVWQPVAISGEKRPVQVAPKRAVQLGSRDDTQADRYNLEKRGVETPLGQKSGRYCEDGMHRAGLPWMPGVFATTGTDAQHSVGYVGGSTPFKGSHSGVLQGECRRPSEGTFGYDYSGLVFKRNTWLLWTHGRRDQGGAGRYETDGPRILPEK